MTYSKPEITNAVSAIPAVRSDTSKPPFNVTDTIDPVNLPKQNSSAYEADE